MSSLLTNLPTVVSRSTITALTSACLTILQKHGISTPANDTRNPLIEQFEDITERVCASVCGDVEPRTRKHVSLKACKIDRRALDIITLECALVFAQKIPTEIHHNETLNRIRGLVVDLLVHSGYQNLRPLCMSPKPCWCSYAAWENIARADGMTNSEIANTRRWFKTNHPEDYEESIRT